MMGLRLRAWLTAARRMLPVLLALLVGGTALAPSLGALELTMLRTAHPARVHPRVADLVRAEGRGDHAALQRPLAVPIHRPTLVPASEVRHALSDSLEGDSLVITGGRTAVVPASLRRPSQGALYAELLLFLEDRYPGEGRLELEVLGDPGVYGLQPGATPVFSARPVGDLVEIAWRSVEGDRGSLLARMRISSPAGDHGAASTTVVREAGTTAPETTTASEAMTAPGPGTMTRGSTTPPGPAQAPKSPQAPGALAPREQPGDSWAVRSGERVQVRFLRGAIQVTMPGRALRSGRIGDTVAVRPYDSSSRFDARVVGPREVLVEMR